MCRLLLCLLPVFLSLVPVMLPAKEPREETGYFGMADKHIRVGSAHFYYESYSLFDWFQTSVATGTLFSLIQTLPGHLSLLNLRHGTGRLEPSALSLPRWINDGLLVYGAYSFSNWLGEMGTDLWYLLNPVGSKLPQFDDLNANGSSHFYFRDRLQIVVSPDGEYHIHVPMHMYYPSGYFSLASTLPEVIKLPALSSSLTAISRITSAANPESFAKPLASSLAKLHILHKKKDIMAILARLYKTDLEIHWNNANVPASMPKPRVFLSGGNRAANSLAVVEHRGRQQSHALVPRSVPVAAASKTGQTSGKNGGSGDNSEKEGSVSYLLGEGGKKSSVGKPVQGGGAGGGGGKQPGNNGGKKVHDPVPAQVMPSRKPFKARVRPQSEAKIVGKHSSWSAEQIVLIEQLSRVTGIRKDRLQSADSRKALLINAFDKLGLRLVRAEQCGKPLRLNEFHIPQMPLEVLKKRIAKIELYHKGQDQSTYRHEGDDLKTTEIVFAGGNIFGEKWLYDLLALLAESGSTRGCYLYLDEKISEYVQMKWAEGGDSALESEVYEEIKYYLKLFKQHFSQSANQQQPGNPATVYAMQGSVAGTAQAPPSPPQPRLSPPQTLLPPPGLPPPGLPRPIRRACIPPGYAMQRGALSLFPVVNPPWAVAGRMMMRFVVLGRPPVPAVVPVVSIHASEPLPPPPPVPARAEDITRDELGGEYSSDNQDIMLSSILVEESEGQWEQVILDAVVQFNEGAAPSSGKAVLTGGRAAWWYARRYNSVKFFFNRKKGWSNSRGEVDCGDWDLAVQDKAVAEAVSDRVQKEIKDKYPESRTSYLVHEQAEKYRVKIVYIADGGERLQYIDIFYGSSGAVLPPDDSEVLPVIELDDLEGQLERLIKVAEGKKDSARKQQLETRLELLEGARASLAAERSRKAELSAQEEVTAETEVEVESTPSSENGLSQPSSSLSPAPEVVRKNEEVSTPARGTFEVEDSTTDQSQASGSDAVSLRSQEVQESLSSVTSGPEQENIAGKAADVFDTPQASTAGERDGNELPSPRKTASPDSPVHEETVQKSSERDSVVSTEIDTTTDVAPPKRIESGSGRHRWSKIRKAQSAPPAETVDGLGKSSPAVVKTKPAQASTSITPPQKTSAHIEQAEVISTDPAPTTEWTFLPGLPKRGRKTESQLPDTSIKDSTRPAPNGSDGRLARKPPAKRPAGDGAEMPQQSHKRSLLALTEVPSASKAERKAYRTEPQHQARKYSGRESDGSVEVKFPEIRAPQGKPAISKTDRSEVKYRQKSKDRSPVTGSMTKSRDNKARNNKPRNNKPRDYRGKKADVAQKVVVRAAKLSTGPAKGKPAPSTHKELTSIPEAPAQSVRRKEKPASRAPESPVKEKQQKEKTPEPPSVAEIEGIEPADIQDQSEPGFSNEPEKAVAEGEAKPDQVAETSSDVTPGVAVEPEVSDKTEATAMASVTPIPGIEPEESGEAESVGAAREVTPRESDAKSGSEEKSTIAEAQAPAKEKKTAKELKRERRNKRRHKEYKHGRKGQKTGDRKALPRASPVQPDTTSDTTSDSIAAEPEESVALEIDRPAPEGVSSAVITEPVETVADEPALSPERSPSPLPMPKAYTPDDWYYSLRRNGDRMALGQASISDSRGLDIRGCHSLSELRLGKFLMDAGASLRHVSDSGFHITIESDAVIRLDNEMPLAVSTIPDLAFLSAMMLPWDINSLVLFEKLHAARYFPQAVPYLASILLDTESVFFNPYLLGAIVRELLPVEYPGYRQYHVPAAPEWSGKSGHKAHVEEIAGLFALPAPLRAGELKKMCSKLNRQLAKGAYSEDIAVFLDGMGSLSKKNKQLTIDKLKKEPGNPVRNWLIYRLLRGEGSGAETPKLEVEPAYHFHHLDLALTEDPGSRQKHYTTAIQQIREVLIQKDTRSKAANAYAKTFIIFHEEIYLKPDMLEKRVKSLLEGWSEQDTREEVKLLWSAMDKILAGSQWVNMRHHWLRAEMGRLSKAEIKRLYSRLAVAKEVADDELYTNLRIKLEERYPDIGSPVDSGEDESQKLTNRLAVAAPDSCVGCIRQALWPVFRSFSSVHPGMERFPHSQHLKENTLIDGWQKVETSFQPVSQISDLQGSPDDYLTLGAASILTSPSQQSSQEDQCVQLLKQMNTFWARSGSRIYLTAIARSVRKALGQTEFLPVPELAFLKARLHEWQPESPEFVQLLFRARHFHEAFPYLVEVMLNPLSPGFQPFTLKLLADEIRMVSYPNTRGFKLQGFPRWPEPGKQARVLAQLLLTDDGIQGDGLTRIKQVLMDAVLEGSYGMIGTCHFLNCFSADESEFIVQRLRQIVPDQQNPVTWLIEMMTAGKGRLPGQAGLSPEIPVNDQYALDLALRNPDDLNAPVYFLKSSKALSGKPGGRGLPAVLLNHRVYQDPVALQSILDRLLETSKQLGGESDVTGQIAIAMDAFKAAFKAELRQTQSINLYHQFLLLKTGELDEREASEFFKRLVVAFRVESKAQYQIWLKELAATPEYQVQAEAALAEMEISPGENAD